MHTGFWCGDTTEKDHLENTRMEGMIILKRIFKKWDGAWTGLFWLRVGTGAVSCECGNETSDSIKCGEFLD